MWKWWIAVVFGVAMPYQLVHSFQCWRSMVPLSLGAGNPTGVQYSHYCHNVALYNDLSGQDIFGLSKM